MFKQIAILIATLVAVQAYGPAITTQDQNILRSYGNLGQVSTFSKTIDTPFSSVRKSDVRVSNPGLTIAAPYAHAPYTHAAYAPAAYAPAAYAPAAYSPAAYAPAAYAPAAYAAHTYASPLVSPVAHVAHVAPVTKTVAAPGGLLGVAYSAAPAVAHMTYSNGLGVSYAW